MTDLAFASARQIAAMIRRGKLGCLEALDHAIARVERMDGPINAVVVRDVERARKRARRLDRRGESTGPLHGVPMTVKESFDIAGLPSTWGIEAYRGNVAQTNALAVDRLLDAGAVIFGKTNVPHLLADWQSFNVIYGATNNPWDLSRTPGGSSGGSAAALAAGFSALELGSDIGGSIRQPAHNCGVFGHKPTWGLCPPRGHSLTGAAAMTDISVIGPLARSAEDLMLALDAIAGPDPGESALRQILPPPRGRSFGELRIAVWPDDPIGVTDAAIAGRLRELAKFLKREGAKVSLTARPAFDAAEAYHLYLKLLGAALGGRQNAAEQDATRARNAARTADDTSADAILDRHMVDLPHGGFLALNERRHQLRRLWTAFFEDWDVLLCPVLGLPAMPHMPEVPIWQRRVNVNGHEMPFNDLLFWPGLTGGYHLPASVAPLGFTSTGLPFGVQIVGPIYGDRTTLTMARLLERAWQGFTPPPALARAEG